MKRVYDNWYEPTFCARISCSFLMFFALSVFWLVSIFYLAVFVIFSISLCVCVLVCHVPYGTGIYHYAFMWHFFVFFIVDCFCPFLKFFLNLALLLSIPYIFLKSVSFNRVNIEGTNSSNICVWCLCMYVLFCDCVGICFGDWLEKGYIYIYKMFWSVHLLLTEFDYPEVTCAVDRLLKSSD